MTRQEDKEDREMQRAIADLARTTKQIKKKNWERYKYIYPDLYAEEFGIDRSISPKIQKIMDKEQEKIDNIQEENSILKEYIKKLEKANTKRDKYIEKMVKEIEKKDKEITKLKEMSHKVKSSKTTKIKI
jgi:SMC interacting uncharacterized protein involved in chromosome segregation